MEMERGFRARLADYLNTSCPLQVKITTSGGAVYDTFCFGLDAEEKISDDGFVVFYNQGRSPGGEIVFRNEENEAVYEVQLKKLPGRIEKLAFAISIDGEGTMHEISAHRIQIVQNGEVRLEVSLDGSDFEQERAIIGIELYYTKEWRIAVVARGFNEGLKELLRLYEIKTL
jgi:stress response protein SCP2